MEVNTLMTTLSEEETEKIACAINHYLQPQYSRITDIYTVIENRRQVPTQDESIIWAYDCPCQTVYLDEDAYAVDCGRQVVEKIFFNEHDEILVDQTGQFIKEAEPEDYDHMIAKVYYDPREDITPPEQDFQGDVNTLPSYIYLGEYEWQRTKPGGGGII